MLSHTATNPLALEAFWPQCAEFLSQEALKSPFFLFPSSLVTIATPSSPCLPSPWFYINQSLPFMASFPSGSWFWLHLVSQELENLQLIHLDAANGRLAQAAADGAELIQGAAQSHPEGPTCGKIHSGISDGP